uniref:Uncharacterized protein n=1 Tax=Nonomuraea gerenzanensis TaxID=93944 RepID=A0A1M4EJL6_9ACTN|nr:hypothetical protein BN4615_P8591 [Nonomuraea gerenzanensis]
MVPAGRSAAGRGAHCASFGSWARATSSCLHHRRAGLERMECDALSGRNRDGLAGVATDGTADTLKIDVSSTDEHGVRWHASRLLRLSEMSNTGSRVWDSGPLCLAFSPAGASRAPTPPAAPAPCAGSRTRSRRGSPRGVCPYSCRRSR